MSVTIRLTDSQKIQGFERSQRFFSELLDSVETLGGIAEIHGARTLSDIMFLQNCLLTGGFVDHYPGESNVLQLVSNLPSGSEWAQFIKVEYLMQSPSAVESNVRCNYSLSLRGFPGGEESSVQQVLTVGSNLAPDLFLPWLKEHALYLPDGKGVVTDWKIMPCSADIDFVLPTQLDALKQRIKVLIGQETRATHTPTEFRIKDMTGKPVNESCMQKLYSLVSAAADAEEIISVDELEEHADSQRR